MTDQPWKSADPDETAHLNTPADPTATTGPTPPAAPSPDNQPTESFPSPAQGAPIEQTPPVYPLAPTDVTEPTMPGNHTATFTGVPQAPAGYQFAEPASNLDPRMVDAAAAQDPAATADPTAPQGPGAQGTGADGLAFGVPADPALPYAAPTKERRRPGWMALLVAGLVGGLVASGATYGVVRTVAPTTNVTQSSAPAAPTSSSTTELVPSNGSAPNWEQVSTAVAGAVVSITVRTDSGVGSGSGVIYDSQGRIVTNHHVVAGASRIQVTLADGRIYEADITGSDAATDLAVITLRNAPSNLTVAQWGNSDDVKTGQAVMAIGNPLGLSQTATTGIVSATNRPVVSTQRDRNSSGDGAELVDPRAQAGTNTYTNAIQVDAAINPGNSGGPLFDENGRVIGITSSIIEMTENTGSIGLGFAIPSNQVVRVANQLIASGRATHAYLGVSIINGVAQTGSEVRAGAELSSVESGSPAAQAGLREGDVVTALNGHPVAQADALTASIRQYSAGDQVTLTVVRDGQSMEVPVVLAERADS